MLIQWPKELYHLRTHTHILVRNSGHCILDDSLDRLTLGVFLANNLHLIHRGVQALQLRPVLAALLSHCVTTLHDHVVRDLCSPHTDSPSTQTREDECVVPLSNGNRAAIGQWNVVCGCHRQSGPCCPSTWRRRESLHIGAGVGQRQNGVNFAVCSNCLNNCLSGLPWNTAQADESCGFRALIRLQQVRNITIGS